MDVMQPAHGDQRNLQRALVRGLYDRGALEDWIVLVARSEHFHCPGPVVVGNAFSFFQMVHRESHQAPGGKYLAIGGIDIPRLTTPYDITGLQSRHLYGSCELHFDI